MAQIVFRSKYAALRIHFDPKRFGTMDALDGDSFETDANGHVITVLTTDPNDSTKQIAVAQRKRVAKPAAQFTDSMLVLDDSKPMQKTMLEDLRKIVAGRVLDQHGRKFFIDNELWEEDQHTTDVINQLSGAVLVDLPQEFNDEDREMFKSLESYFHNAIPRPALNSAMALLDAALTRFHVRGIKTPVQERAIKQLRPRIIELVFAIQDAAEALKMEPPFNLDAPTRQTSTMSAADLSQANA